MNPPLEKIDPKTTALLVMDCQNGIVGRIEDSDALIERVARAIATARRRGVRIGYVRVAFDEADAKAIPAANKGFSRMARMIGAFHSDAPATQIDARIAPQPGDITVVENLRRRVFDDKPARAVGGRGHHDAITNFSSSPMLARIPIPRRTNFSLTASIPTKPTSSRSPTSTDFFKWIAAQWTERPFTSANFVFEPSIVWMGATFPFAPGAKTRIDAGGGPGTNGSFPTYR